jgi:tetratricopeptide (TPR) repeat protein
VTEPETPLNPFPGLRPYEPDEDYLFFGREEEVDELLRRLRFNRFLAVVGTSGCGKSSLVRSGLIPALHSGTMVRVGSSWHVAIMRPGESPISHLAAALDAPGIIRPPSEELATTNRVLLDAALRRGTRGLVETVRDAGFPTTDNLLIVVDQFEELFRYRRGDRVEQSRDEAAAFVKLLLEATNQEAVPIYVVLTMRADFIGECVEYQGLPEALNASQYLVPRLTRDEVRAAITGPVAVAGGKIAARLVVRILNDLGSDQDQLPVLQHAMMRTWEHWRRSARPGEPIDIAHYEAVGTLRDALSRHAEEAYREVAPGDQRIAEHVFKALTDTVSDPRGTRRPCPMRTLAAIAGAPEADVARIVDLFRRPGRSFLMPPTDVPLAADVIVDLSHESLMRCWTRLISWTEEERTSASVYLRLSRDAVWFDEGAAALWRDPQLELGLRWRRETNPTAAWARRYDDSFDRAMRFLDRSEQERERERTERAAARRRQVRILQGTVALLIILLAAALWGFFASRSSANLAEQNLRDAVRAVDESLRVIDRDPVRLGIDHAEIVRFQRELALRAATFYGDFIKRGYTNVESVRQAMASAHFGLGHANRVLGDQTSAAREYRTAIEQLEGLARDYDSTPRYRQDLGNAYTFLGEALRQSRDTYDDAEEAYGNAMRLQEALRREQPARDAYRTDLARTRYNRGILLWNRAVLLEDAAIAAGRSDAPDIEAAFDRAASDFRQAIELLEPLADVKSEQGPAQGLARALNDLGNVLARRMDRLSEAERLISRATMLHEDLRTRFPDNRELAVELAKFYNNLASLQREQGNTEAASESSRRSLDLVRQLARPAPSIGVDLADSHTVRGSVFERTSVEQSLAEYREALTIFEGLAQDVRAQALPEFHERFGDLLVNLAILAREHPRAEDARQLLLRAVGRYLSVAEAIASTGTPATADLVLASMSRLLPELSDRDRAGVVLSYKEWEARLQSRAARKN